MGLNGLLITCESVPIGRDRKDHFNVVEAVKLGMGT